jgi:predicted 2-oxoglutarate/Fe(II)-dependent dioxygenase YbiX
MIVQSTSNQLSSFRDNLNHASCLDGKGTVMAMAASVKQNAQANPDDPKVKQLTDQPIIKYFWRSPQIGFRRITASYISPFL